MPPLPTPADVDRAAERMAPRDPVLRATVDRRPVVFGSFGRYPA